MRAIKRVVVLLVLIAAGIGGWSYYRAYAEKKSQPAYETRKIQSGNVAEKVLTTGTLQPVTTVAVGSQISGIVQKLYVDFNSQVKAGQVIARIDASQLLAQKQQTVANMDNAQAGLQNASANLDNAVSNVRNAQAGIHTAEAAMESARVAAQSARAQLEQARAGLNKARANLDSDKLGYTRNEQLLKQDLVAQSDLDAARTTYLVGQADLQTAQAQYNSAVAAENNARAGISSAQAALEAARIKKESADTQVAAAKSQVASAQAQVKKAQADLDQVDINLGYCTIHSPVNGIVISRNVDQGQTIAASFQAPTLFSLATDLRTMQVKANVDEADISRVFVQQRATFTVDAYPEDTFDGTVVEVRNSPVTVQNVVTYEVLMNVKNESLRLKPGMTANIALLVKEKKDVLLVPNMALRFRPEGEVAGKDAPSKDKGPPGGSRGDRPRKPRNSEAGRPQKVWVLENGAPASRDVRVGVTDGTNTELKPGSLRTGDEVIVGTEGPKPSGSPVKRPFF